MSIRNRTYLSQFIPVARGLQQYLGDMYEVILHDVSEPNASIVFIAGDLTHRTVGDPLTNVVIEEMKRHGDDASPSCRMGGISSPPPYSCATNPAFCAAACVSTWIYRPISPQLIYSAALFRP